VKRETSLNKNQLKPNIHVDGVNIHYTGTINFEGALKFVNLVIQHPKVNNFYIHSKSGIAGAGLFLAHHIHRKKMNVVVDKACYFVCANYIFMAGHKKTLNQESDLQFQGGARSVSDLLYFYDIGQLTAAEKLAEPIQHKFKAIEQELALYKKLGVDINLPYYGQFSKTLKDNQNGKAAFYYKLEDLVSMGVKNIALKKKPPQSLEKQIVLTDDLKAALPPPDSKYQLVIRENEKERYEERKDWIFAANDYVLKKPAYTFTIPNNF